MHVRTALRTVIVVGITLAAGGCAPRDQDPTAETIDRYLSARLALGRFSGAALVMRDGVVVWRKGYGFADVERRVPYTAQTAQPVASISKMFTAMAALELADGGKLDLADSVCRHLPDCPAGWRDVTIDHLIQHRSGIPDYEARLDLGSEAYFAWMTGPDPARRILEDAKGRPLDFAPGTEFHYSNTGYVVLGFAVERAAEVPFAELVQAKLLGPAGMVHSTVAGTPHAAQPPAVGYTFGDLGWPATLKGAALTAGHLRPVPPLSLPPPQGDAWLLSTVDDLAAWCRWLDESGRAKRHALDAAARDDGYHHGWIADRAFDRQRLHHNGILPGYVSELIRFPAERLTIVLISNLDRVRLSRIARDLSAIALGAPFDMPVSGTVVELTAEQIAALVGEYETADGRSLSVRKEPDYLVAEMKGQYVAGLIPLSATEMYVPLADGTARFEIGPNGRALRVNMRFNGEDLIAERSAVVPGP